MKPILVGGQPDLRAELRAYFAQFYQARTLTPGGPGFDVATITNLTAPPYRDYTTALLQRSQDDVDAGKLTAVTYSKIDVQVMESADLDRQTTAVTAQVTRTQTQGRSDSHPAPLTAALLFRLHRQRHPDGSISWSAYDFFNQGANAWLTDTGSAKPSPDQLSRELQDFFTRFYGARSLAPGGKFDLAATRDLTQFAYRDYTLPLLQKQQDEATAGKLSAVRYSDIKVQVQNWDAQATDHGGLATVAVMRTAHIARPSTTEELQTATYQFRVHRHEGEDGKPFWFAVDFLSPISRQWVSDSAGMTGPVPPSGHG